MSMWGRALAGAGTAAAGIANSYIENDVLTARAQAIADIQRKSGMAQLQDADTFNNDPNRVARNRANKVADITAESGARGDVELAFRKKTALDQDLLTADTARATAITGATAAATAKANADAEISKVSDPRYIKGEAALARAKHIEGAGSLAQAALANFQLGVAKNLNVLQGQLAEAQTIGNKDAAESIQAQIDAFSGKGGKVDKFYAIAEKATAGMKDALKVINDQFATPDAKEEANIMLRQQRALMESAAKRAGVDITSERYPQPGPQAVAALLKERGKAAEFDARFGPGAAEKALKGAPQDASLASKAAGAMAPDRQPLPSEEVDPNSFAGRARAQAAQRVRDKNSTAQRDTDRAQAEYAALLPGDKSAAARLQASPLFGLLSPEQKSDIYHRVNAR